MHGWQRQIGGAERHALGCCKTAVPIPTVSLACFGFPSTMHGPAVFLQIGFFHSWATGPVYRDRPCQHEAAPGWVICFPVWHWGGPDALKVELVEKLLGRTRASWIWISTLEASGSWVWVGETVPNTIENVLWYLEESPKYEVYFIYLFIIHACVCVCPSERACLHVCACVSVWRLENSPYMLFLTGLELASKSQASPCIRLTSAGIKHMPRRRALFLQGFWYLWLLLQACFFLSYHFSCPREYFSFSPWSCHQTPDTPLPPCEDGDRGSLPAAPLSLSAPAHLQELSKAPSTKCMAERSEWDFALLGFPFRNGNEIWLVRRMEPVLRELVSSSRRKCELWRVPLTLSSYLGSKVRLSVPVRKRLKTCSLLLMIHRFGKYWFTWDPWGSGEINVIFINTSCIRPVVIETRMERTAEAWAGEETCSQSLCSFCIAFKSYSYCHVGSS